MTEHPAARCTRKQREVFEQIAIGLDAGQNPKTLDALLRRGLIEKTGHRTLGRDRFGPIIIPIYQVPIAIHYQWCQWCSENVSDDEIP